MGPSGTLLLSTPAALRRFWRWPTDTGVGRGIAGGKDDVRMKWRRSSRSSPRGDALFPNLNENANCGTPELWMCQLLATQHKQVFGFLGFCRTLWFDFDFFLLLSLVQPYAPCAEQLSSFGSTSRCSTAVMQPPSNLRIPVPFPRPQAGQQSSAISWKLPVGIGKAVDPHQRIVCRGGFGLVTVPQLQQGSKCASWALAICNT